ncbi:MAG TPA: tRNA (adenine-N1)-methyltransferase [Terriglobales bacterium]|nr:tRNA (adenine-N1)-methyltransferase [Terriglobales bacterium]
MSELSPAHILQSGDSVLLIDPKEREYLRTLSSGKRIHLHGGLLNADDIIGRPDGLIVRNSAGQEFVVVRPTFAQLIPNLPRRAQVIYPKDIGPILLWGDIYPGATVIEVGVGPGALTMALLRTIGPTGRLISYECREDHIEMARENVARFIGPVDNWTVHLADATCGFEERNVDRMTVDMPEPWRLTDAAAETLRPGGVFLGYIPTVLQVKQLADALQASPHFDLVQVSESLQRFWHVKQLSIRPEHRMVAHTGFLVSARRVVRLEAS